MMAVSNDTWIFSDEQIKNSPSIQRGMSFETEVIQREKAALLIDNIGWTLKINEYCIFRAILFMQRFYMSHPFHIFSIESLCPASIFVAAKTEDLTLNIRQLVRTTNLCMRHDKYYEKMIGPEEIQQSEEMLLATLGFNIFVEIPSSTVSYSCGEYNIPSKTRYFANSLASAVLYTYILSVKYSTPTLTCFCIRSACKWTNFEIDHKEWYLCHDETFNEDKFDLITNEFTQALQEASRELQLKYRVILQYLKVHDDTTEDYESQLYFSKEEEAIPSTSKHNESPEAAELSSEVSIAVQMFEQLQLENPPASSKSILKDKSVQQATKTTKKVSLQIQHLSANLKRKKYPKRNYLQDLQKKLDKEANKRQVSQGTDKNKIYQYRDQLNILDLSSSSSEDEAQALSISETNLEVATPLRDQVKRKKI